MQKPEERDYGTLSDEELFALFRSDDRAAFSQLYGRFHRRIYNYCLRVTGERDRAEDLFQEIMMTIYEKRREFTGGNVGAWVFTIARFKALYDNRTRGKNERLEDVHLRLLPVEEASDNDFILDGAVRDAIDNLPEDLQQAFIFKVIDGYAHEEIAAILNISPELARVRVFRAKKILKKQLSPFIKE